MNGLWPFCLLAGLISLPVLSSPAHDYHFDVYLDDKKIGFHRFSFEPTDTGYRVESRARYSVEILFVDVYSYSHSSTETWWGGCLRTIDADTDDNGDNYSVKGHQAQGRVHLTVGGDSRVYDERCVVTFAYWNPELLNREKLLNSQTGELEPVALEYLGSSRLPWNQNALAENYVLETGKGNIELWYLKDRRWLGLRSELDNGRVLSYRPVAGEGSGE